MAIENILKGVLIQRDPTIASDEAFSKEWPGGKPASRTFRPTDWEAIDRLFARLVAIMESEKGGT